MIRIPEQILKTASNQRSSSHLNQFEDFLLRDKISSFRGTSVPRGGSETTYSETVPHNFQLKHPEQLFLSPNTSQKDLLKGQIQKLASNSILIPEIKFQSSRTFTRPQQSNQDQQLYSITDNTIKVIGNYDYSGLTNQFKNLAAQNQHVRNNAKSKTFESNLKQQYNSKYPISQIGKHGKMEIKSVKRNGKISECPEIYDFGTKQLINQISLSKYDASEERIQKQNRNFVSFEIQKNNIQTKQINSSKFHQKNEPFLPTDSTNRSNQNLIKGKSLQKLRGQLQQNSTHGRQQSMEIYQFQNNDYGEFTPQSSSRIKALPVSNSTQSLQIINHQSSFYLSPFQEQFIQNAYSYQHFSNTKTNIKPDSFQLDLPNFDEQSQQIMGFEQPDVNEITRNYSQSNIVQTEVSSSKTLKRLNFTDPSNSISSQQEIILRPIISKVKLPKVLLPKQASIQNPTINLAKLPISQQSTILTTLDYPSCQSLHLNQVRKTLNKSASKTETGVYRDKNFDQQQQIHSQYSDLRQETNPFNQGPKLHHYKRRLQTSSATRLGFQTPSESRNTIATNQDSPYLIIPNIDTQQHQQVENEGSTQIAIDCVQQSEDKQRPHTTDPLYFESKANNQQKRQSLVSKNQIQSQKQSSKIIIEPQSLLLSEQDGKINLNQFIYSFYNDNQQIPLEQDDQLSCPKILILSNVPSQDSLKKVPIYEECSNDQVLELSQEVSMLIPSTALTPCFIATPHHFEDEYETPRLLNLNE